jgi:hypothetical protein
MDSPQRTRRAQRGRGGRKKKRGRKSAVERCGKRVGDDSEMGRLIMLEEALRGFGQGGYTPLFSYQGETKGLRENGLYQGETKDLGENSVRMREWGVPKWHKSRVPSA